MTETEDSAMKYKVLINQGENPAIIRDFFIYTQKYFTAYTTTDIWEDVVNHFEAVKPDVYIIFMESAYSEAVTQIPRLKTNSNYNDAPIIVIGKREDCNDFEQNHPHTASMIIRRPISSDNIALSVIAFLEKGHEEQISDNTRKKILVVDDDRTILKMIKAAIEDKYDVTAMLNGVMVERFLSMNEVDLVILDYEMPIMTGAAIFRMMKENPKFSKIPVCFLTGVSEREKVEEIMSLRPRGYLLKPINMEMLLATIANLA